MTCEPSKTRVRANDRKPSSAESPVKPEEVAGSATGKIGLMAVR